MFNNCYQGKRVLVTGHTGFKGSWLSLWLTRLGAEVRGFSDQVPTSPANFEISGLKGSIKSHMGDIRNQKAIKDVLDDFRPEVVFHLAAEAIVRTCYDDPMLAFETNAMGTAYLMDCLRQASSVKAAIFITSDKCYENVEWEYGYREGDGLGGKDPYSASKACAEIIFSSLFRSYFEDSDLKMCTTRAGNVIGGGDWAKNRIIPDCVRSWSKNEPVLIRSPKSTRPWQHVLEPLGGYLWAGANLLENKIKSGESYNFGPSADFNYPVEDLILEMKKTWNNVQFQIDPKGQGNKKEAGLLKLCCDKALDHLSWKAILTFPETVAMTALWYKDYYEGNHQMSSFTNQQIEQYEKKAQQHGLLWAQE